MHAAWAWACTHGRLVTCSAHVLRVLPCSFRYVWPDTSALRLRLLSCFVLVLSERVVNLAVPLLYKLMVGAELQHTAGGVNHACMRWVGHMQSALCTINSSKQHEGHVPTWSPSTMLEFGLWTLTVQVDKLSQVSALQQLHAAVASLLLANGEQPAGELASSLVQLVVQVGGVNVRQHYSRTRLRGSYKSKSGWCK